MKPRIEREEIVRHRCLGDDETPLFVIEYRLVEVIAEAGKVRRRPGVRRVELQNGEPLRLIDARTFEVTRTGELLRRLD